MWAMFFVTVFAFIGMQFGIPGSAVLGMYALLGVVAMSLINLTWGVIITILILIGWVMLKSR